MAGSAKRQRTKIIQIRCTAHERDKAARLADRAGLSLGAFARAAMLGDSGPRAQRRPPADHKALRQILGHLGKLGSNANQIARALNAALLDGDGRTRTSAADAAVAAYAGIRDEYLHIRNAIFQALGHKADAGQDRHGHQGRQS